MFNSKLYNTPYHKGDLSNYKFLITGGAGFIGSNLVEYLLRFGAGHVRVLDNLSNGYLNNIEQFIQYPNFEFIQGDIRDYNTCKEAVKDMDYISHQAALGSVPRSINDPVLTNEVNISGFLNMLTASKDEKSVKRFIYAASSSTYGDHPDLPKIENKIGSPLSPYAVTKLVNELYAEVYGKVYNFNTVGLRYFNVFGPRQSPDNPYAAVIPLFLKAALNGVSPVINGDGETSRDFTFVENVVQANIKGLFAEDITKFEIFNIACGESTTLNTLWRYITNAAGIQLVPTYRSERIGDVKHSLADISKASRAFDYQPSIKIKEGLKMLIQDIQSQE